jgi:hypothetical protein
MKTFVVENVLGDYTPGLIIVKAKNIESAKKLLKEQFDDTYEDVTNGIREMQDNEIVYVYGGG